MTASTDPWASMARRCVRMSVSCPTGASPRVTQWPSLWWRPSPRSHHHAAQPSFPLTFSYETANGPVEIPLRMRGVVITGRVVGQNIVDIIIGGSLQKGEFEATVRGLLPLIDGEVTFEDVAPILASLYDIGANCTDLSIGLVANASSAP